MKERPILFNASMVRAILSGAKTQTRRKAKLNDAGRVYRAGKNWHMQDKEAVLACPYGTVGDSLWVRESFQPIFADGFTYSTVDWNTGHGYAINYPATEGATEWVDADDEITDRCMPSIHMPRWASRITLKITGVRVERLQEISSDDCFSEGINPEENETYLQAEHYQTGGSPLRGGSPERCAYSELWEKINGSGSWAENPWVWVVGFERVTG